MSGLISLNDLKTKFRSAGQYTVIVDKSITPSTPAVAINRLVAGFSKTGNWNAPFFINRGNFELAENLYGAIDPQLEKQGSFFQRMLRVSLEEGDVLALNLLKTVNEVDEMGVPTPNADVCGCIALSSTPTETNGNRVDKLYASFYNKERFWSPSPDYLLATAKTGAIPNNRLLYFTNLGQRKVSIIVRKTESTQYEQKAIDWFGGEENVPGYVNKNYKMKEYIVDVIVIGGDFTDYNKLKNDPYFAQYFDVNGLIIDKLDEFLNERNVNVLNFYTGALIPLKDQNGNDLRIDNIINKQTSLTGMLCAVDENLLYAEGGLGTIDLVGDSLIDESPEINLLSYKGKLGADSMYTISAKTWSSYDSEGAGLTITNSQGKITVNVSSAHPDFGFMKLNARVGFTVLQGEITSDGVDFGGLTAGDTDLILEGKSESESNLSMVFSNNIKKMENRPANQSYTFVETKIEDVDDVLLMKMDFNRGGFFINADELGYTADAGSEIYKDFEKGVLMDGDEIRTSSNTYYVKFVRDYIEDGVTKRYSREAVRINLFKDDKLTIPIENPEIAPTAGSTFNSDWNPVASGICVVSPDNAYQDHVEIAGSINPSSVYVMDDGTIDYSIYSIGDRVVAVNEESVKYLAEITNIYNEMIGGQKALIFEFSGNIYLDVNDKFTVQKEFSRIFSTYNLIGLNGFELKDHHMPNNTNDRMKEIYSVMTEGNIRKTLVDPEFVSWRYFIDTFGHGIEPQSKRYITQMIRDRQKALGILNMPSVEELRKHSDPRFTDNPTAVNPLPSFSTKHIVTGGNLQARPRYTYSLPRVADGVDFAGWFFPFMSVLEDNVEKLVPPSGYVGNAFMRKWNGGGYGQAVAGALRGTLTGEGLDKPEIHLDKEDRGDIKEFGANPIYKRGNNIVIYGNNTGLTEYNSILQHLHARDILITMEIELSAILESYEFVRGVMTDETTRTLIETSLENYLENQRDAQGNIVEFTLVLDRTNNPDWVAQNGALIIDIGVTLPEVTDKFITRITLNRSGAGVTTSSFSAV